MAQTFQDFEIYQGEDAQVIFTIDQSVSGSTITWQASRDEYSTAAVTKDTSDGVSIGGTSNDTVTVVIDSDEVNGLWGDYYHELVAVDGSGKRTVLATGKMSVIQSSTNTPPS